SVPAYFTNNQKEDTREAGRQAGVNVLRLVPEPTAAAVAYGLNQGRDQTILVFDLGGGTFDVSILKVVGNNFDVVGIGGDDQLGGEDFDRRLIDWIVKEIRKDEGARKKMESFDPAALALQVKEAAELAKKELSSAEQVEVEVPAPDGSETFFLTLTRQQYEAEIRDLVNQTIDVTMRTLRESKLSPDDVDRIVAVGGSTRIPLIRKVLAEKICEPFIAENVDEIVAQGAAIVGAGISAVAETTPDMAPVEVSNVTAHSLGIRADKDRFAVVIPRSTRLPASISKTFTTAQGGADRTDVVVFQGEAEQCTENNQIGGFALTGLRKGAAGDVKIDVTFKIDEDDILEVTAVERGTGKGGHVQIEKFEPLPYVPQAESEVSLNSLRMGVSPPGCDDAGTILKQLGLKFNLVANGDFQSKKVVNQHDLLFINCLCDPMQLFTDGMLCNPAKNAKTLQDFVTNGGVLYVSDYAFGNITRIFPGKIKFDGRTGPVGKHQLNVLDPEMKQVIGATARADFGPGYVVVNSVSNDCQVYMTRGKEPVLVSFPYGKGHVVYTSFHNSASIDANSAKIVSSMILQTVSLATSTPLIELVESTHLRKA
ncbi:MAG: Hsp70 family protein, partial [Planctomycetaceae bacterium]|nr:Hsp70 family protein [Planctomycetaceae bacterium]